MRICALIDKDGVFLNDSQNKFIKASPITGEAGSSLFLNQLTVEFYTGITTAPNGLIVPDPATVVNTGLTGTIKVQAWPSINAPYPVDLASDTIDISDSCILQWTGLTEALDILCTSIVGANYINLLLDRN